MIIYGSPSFSFAVSQATLTRAREFFLTSWYEQVKNILFDFPLPFSGTVYVSRVRTLIPAWVRFCPWEFEKKKNTPCFRGYMVKIARQRMDYGFHALQDAWKVDTVKDPRWRPRHKFGLVYMARLEYLRSHARIA